MYIFMFEFGWYGYFMFFRLKNTKKYKYLLNKGIKTYFFVKYGHRLNILHSYFDYFNI